jgi:hypothetical protein
LRAENGERLAFILKEKQIILPDASEFALNIYNNWTTPNTVSKFYDSIILELVVNKFAPFILVGTHAQFRQGAEGIFAHPINRPSVMSALSEKLSCMFDEHKRAWVKIVRLGFEPEDGIGIA